MADFFGDVVKELGGVLPMLGVYAPTLATALGGPLAGTVAKLVVSGLGMTEQSAPKEVAAAVVSAAPDQIAALKKVEFDFKAQMRQLDITEEQLSFDDIKDARARQVQVKDWTPPVLGLFVTGGFFGLLGLMAFHDLPPGNTQILNIMLGSLGAGFTGVLSYYFGSSRGSDKKTELLANSVPAK